MRVAPVFVPAGTTITTLWWGQTAAAAAGGFFRPVIYSVDPTYFYPGALLLDAGQQAADGANGDKSLAITAIAFADDTVVFAGGVAQAVGTASFRNTLGATQSFAFWPTLGWLQGPSNTNNGLGFRHDGVTGAPPVTFNTPSYSVGGTVITGAPWVGLQVQ